MEIFAQFQHWNGFLNDSSGLHWTNHVTLSPDCDNSEFTQQDGRKRRTAKCVCVTNVTGLLLVCVVVIFTKYQCFSVFYKKIRLKEDEVWGNYFFKQNYCHACQTRFAVFLALPPCCVSSHTKMAVTVKNLTFTDEELLLNVLVGYNRKGRQQRWLGECKSKVGGA